MNTLGAIWAVVVALWNTGNRWLRVAIAVLLSWPLLVICVAMAGVPDLTALLVLLLVLAVVVGIVAFLDPLVIAVVAAFPRGRRVLGWLAALVGVEALIGIYLSIVPVWNDRGLVPLLILVAIALAFLAPVLRGRVGKNILVVLALLLTVIFFMGGRQEARQRVSGWWTAPSVQARMVAPIKWTLVQGIEAPTGEWSPSYQAPSGRFKLMPGGGQAEVLLDGRYYLLNNIEQVDIGRGGEFRVRAVSENVTVFVYVAE